MMYKLFPILLSLLLLSFSTAAAFSVPSHNETDLQNLKANIPSHDGYTITIDQINENANGEPTALILRYYNHTYLGKYTVSVELLPAGAKEGSTFQGYRIEGNYLEFIQEVYDSRNIKTDNFQTLHILNSDEIQIDQSADYYYDAGIDLASYDMVGYGKDEYIEANVRFC